MKKILFNLPVSAQDSPFLDRPGHTGLEPYIYLRDRLREIGYEIHTPHGHSVQGCARVLFWDVWGVPYLRPRHIGRVGQIVRTARTVVRRALGRPVRRRLYEECLQAGLQDQVALFIGEPPVVFPSTWDRRLHAQFPIVFTWNDRWVDGQRYHKFYYPITGYFPQVPDPPFRQRKLLVNFSGNKFSPHPQELFSARRQTIRYFEQHYADRFALYGPMWDQLRAGQAPYPSWRGWVEHKWQVYPGYRFGLCYENMRGEPGWVTEKIFDCMRAGCVPIYWGASNIQEYADPEAFVDRTQFKSDADLARFLLEMSEHEWQRYREAARGYLASEWFAAFLPPAFTATIIRELDL